MNFDQLTDTDIAVLINHPKRVKNPKARWSEARGTKQKNHIVDGGHSQFGLYLRQSTFDQRNFSCGLWVVQPDGERLTLLRYNGESHIHNEIVRQCHIHKASEEAISLGKKPEFFALQTDRYHSLDGALYCLCQDANIDGLNNLTPDEADLFKQ